MAKVSKERKETIKRIKDEQIDYSDIPELDETFWKHAKKIKPTNEDS